MKNYNFSYDKKNDDLFLYNPHSTSNGAIEIGNIILDFDKNKNIVGIQLINAAQLLHDIAGQTKETLKKTLNSLKNCKISATTKNNIYIIKLQLIGQANQIESLLSLPLLNKESPALAQVNN